MIGLGILSNCGIFHFDKIADMRPCGKLAAGTQARVRTYDTGPVRDDAIEIAVCVHLGAGSERRILDAAERADAYVVAERNATFEHDIDIDFDVVSCSDAAAQIEARGIGDAHTLRHQVARGTQLIMSFELRQLPGVVGTGDRICVGAGDRERGCAILRRETEHVGQIKFALCIAITQSRQPAAQRCGVGRDHAGVDRADRLLFRRAVLLLDDAVHAAGCIEQDASVAGGIAQLGRQHRELRRRFDQRLQDRRAQQRHITVQHEHARAIGDSRHRELHRMPGAALLGLVHPDEISLIRESGLHLLAAMTVNDMHLRRIERPCSIEYMREHRPAGEWQQHFGARGFHAFALAGGEDHDMQRSRWAHAATIAQTPAPRRLFRAQMRAGDLLDGRQCSCVRAAI